MQSVGPPRPGTCAHVHACAHAYSLWREERCPVLTPGMARPPQGQAHAIPNGQGLCPAWPQCPSHLTQLSFAPEGQLHRQTRPPMRQHSQLLGKPTHTGPVC